MLYYYNEEKLLLYHCNLFFFNKYSKYHRVSSIKIISKVDNKTLQKLLTSTLGNDIFLLTTKLVKQGGLNYE